MLTKTRSSLAAVVVLGVLVATTGCGGKSTSATPSPTVTPTVNADGTYQAGSINDGDAAAAVKAAVAALPVAVSYDYRSLNDSLTRATALMTPEFAAKFRQTYEATTIPQATSKKAIVNSLVRAAGVVGQVRDGKVTCLVFLDQVLVASKDRKPKDPIKVVPSSVHVYLTEVDGKWLVNDIEPF